MSNTPSYKFSEGDLIVYSYRNQQWEGVVDGPCTSVSIPHYKVRLYNYGPDRVFILPEENMREADPTDFDQLVSWMDGEIQKVHDSIELSDSSLLVGFNAGYITGLRHAVNKLREIQSNS